VYGSTGDTGLQALEAHGTFRRGATDVFWIEGPDIGAIGSVRVTVTPKGLGPAWHMASLTVTHTGTHEEVAFKYDDWFDAAKGWSQVRLKHAFSSHARVLSSCRHSHCFDAAQGLTAGAA
jgi:hypothetical protein